MTLGLGSNDQRGDPVTPWQREMNRRFSGYERFINPDTGKPNGPMPVDGWFGLPDEAWQKEYERRTHQKVDGKVSDDDLAKLGVKAPTPTARHLGIAFRGTGGIIGQDYVSRVFQGAADLVEERNPHFPATMGGMPVGSAGNPYDVSAQKAAGIGFGNGIAEIKAALKVNPQRKVIIGGYSWGAYVAALLRRWMMENHPDNYLCSFSIGDPTRPFGGSYYLGPKLAGRGISDWLYGDPEDWRHCWLAHPGDMYTNVPLGDTGDIMDTAFRMVTGTQLSDPLATAQAIIPNIPVILEESGIELPDIFKALTGGVPGLIGWVLPLFIGALPGLIQSAGGNSANLTGVAAAAQAAIIAMKFVMAQPPTRDHIMYHFDEVWPGQTYIGLGIQHVRHYASKAPR